ncbi:coagulation factor V isoform 2-T2 [Odontesthes bonariensis]
MRLCPWAGAHRLLPVLLLLKVLYVKADQNPPKERHYYIAAVEINWNYSGNNSDRSSPTYKKVVFREYDKDFKQAKTHPSWLGLLGPTLRAEVGDTIVVTFKNMASGAYSIHPHGVAYGKQSEGANYFDNTSLKEKEDDIVRPDGEHVYNWEVTPEVSPQPDDPTCLTYTYISHQNVVQDYNSGLIGTLLICKPGSLDESGKQVGIHEHVFLFGVFDENESMYTPNGLAQDNHVKYTINGYTKGSLPDVSMCAYASMGLHLVGMSSGPEVFSVHMNGQVLTQNGHKVSSVGLISGSSATASMVTLHTGRWLLSSHTIKHMEAGMHGFVDVKECEDFEKPRRIMTIAQKRESTEWTYYIAAEEIVWDYSPNTQEHVDEDFQHQYLRQSSTRIGRKYKKAVYTLYKNESFTEKLENKQRKNELGILGPVIRAQVRDIIKIVFKNMASRPYSIYPHGLTIEKSQEGVNYPEGGGQSHGVQPGETHTYVWKVLEEDEPLDGDSRCLTRMYHSAVDTPHDIASGLIGPILICKTQSLNVRNVQLRADKEQHAMFAVFDENKSWYLNDNIRQYSDRSKVNKADPEFYKSNVMHTINGYSFESGPVLGFCNGEVVTWHVSSVGAQNYIQTATFYGHPFELNERTEDFLTLYPMTGETISITMDNIGVWLLASLNSHETTKGMRARFQDVECYRDYQYEYDEAAAATKEFTLWKPPTLDDIKKEEERPEKVPETPRETDSYTDMFAAELGLRSLKNQSTIADVEKLDLSFLDYDAIDVPSMDVNISLDLIETKHKTNFSSKPDALNKTQISNWKKVDDLNLTKVHLHDHSISDNATHIDKNSTSDLDNSVVHRTMNTTLFSGHNVSLKNDSLTTDGNVSVVLSKPDNATISDTLNTTVINSTASSVVGNVSADTTSFTTALQGNANLTMELHTVNLTEELQDATKLTIQLQETRNFTVTLPGNSNSISENLTVPGGGHISVDMITSEDSEEQLSRGNVVSYDVPQSKPSTDTLKTEQTEDDSNTTQHVDMSTFGNGHKLPMPDLDVKEVNISSKDRHNLAIFELVVENTDSNENNSLIATTQPEYGIQINSSEVVALSANSSLENATHVSLKNGQALNVTVDVNRSNLTDWNSSESGEIVTAVLGMLNNTSSVESVFSEIVVSSNLSLPDGSSESSEEVFIYLKENNTEVIKTSSFNPQGYNWTYDGTHYMVSKEIPDHMKKYFEKDTPQTTLPPKKSKKVNLRQRPKKGKGLKTRKRMEYKPLARSGLPFSPRGFNPEMTPRGSRPLAPQPVSDENELIDIPVVIGVPRPDFSDYQLYVPGDEPDHLEVNEQDLTADEYEYVMYKDPYSSLEDIKNLNLDETTKYYLKLSGPNVKTYFIAAEEVEWDYAGYGQRQEKSQLHSRDTKFTKVVFRGYLDSSFSTPDIRGEMDEHLGILGPVIKAEVGQSIMVVFRNNANRPYSIHPNGVSYTKQFEGLSYEDGSKYWFKYDNEVQPNTTYTYLWKVNSMVGPAKGESHCRTWAYYSGVNPERDIHSGLIGPLLVCREGTLEKTLPDKREFTLLFMIFDESKSWYYNKHLELIQRKSRRRNMDTNNNQNLKFHSINGIIHSLKGLRMYTNQLVCWHLINMGSPIDFHSVNFHGQTFIHKKTKGYRQAVYPLLPGSFATLEMYPSKPGLWLLETEVGFNQQKGMQTLFLVLDNDCSRPLGLQSGSVTDDQITAINTRGYWEAHLARLNNQGSYNAWSTERNNSWIQVDFQRPVVISQVATQGAKQMFNSHFVEKYSISYSNDRRKWIFYKGDSRDFWKVFHGNQEAYETKKNIFFPPLIGRFIRLHPITWHKAATVRMEFYGCELDGCSVPLGMESGMIKDNQITASSAGSSWYGGSWKPSLARLNQQGTINAWRAKYDNINQWLQVELPQIKKITGIVTQGAKSMGKEMYVTSYILQYSDNGIHWTRYTDDEDQAVKIFSGNSNNNDHAKNYIYPPIFSRFFRIIPQNWIGSITMRIELLGCDFE